MDINLIFVYNPIISIYCSNCSSFVYQELLTVEFFSLVPHSHFCHHKIFQDISVFFMNQSWNQPLLQRALVTFIGELY